MSIFSARSFSPREAHSLSNAWNRLVIDSGADPMFMGWEWLTSWWDVFGKHPRAEWMGILVEDRKGEVAAICPLFQWTRRAKAVLPVIELEPLGGFWRGPSSILTQYSDFLGDFRANPELMGSVLDHLDSFEAWSELVLPMLPAASPTLGILKEEARNRGWTVRAKEAPPSQIVSFEGGFEGYLRTLSHKTRRRLFNHRRRLEELGEVQVVHPEWEDGETLRQLMNRFPRRNGSGGGLSQSALEFHRELGKKLEPPNYPRLSGLVLNGEPISVNYSLRVGKREYGIQMAFDSALATHLSLGMLQLGYALEAAAADGVEQYDLMIKPREGTDWKRSVATAETEMVAFQIIRDKGLSAIYRAYDLLHRVRPR